MKVTKYPDGSSYVSTDGLDIFNTIRINSYEELWQLGQLLESCKHQKLQPIIKIPCLLDAQADRRFSKDQSFGLKLVCNFLNQFPVRYQIFHPHNESVVTALLDNVEIINNVNFINRVLPSLKDERYPPRLKDEFFKSKQGYHIDKRVTDNLILMSADEGGFKPLMKLCEDIGWKGETFSANKSRDPETGKLTQQIYRDDFQGKDILIIDDLCIYGGTFKGLSELLQQRNAGKLYLAVSHLTIQNHKKDPVFNYFHKVFTTNSKYDEYYVPNSKGEPVNPKNLTVINLF